MPNGAKLISIEAVIEAARHAREVEDARKRRRAKMIGNCGLGVKSPCGIKDQEECVVHGPLLPEIS